jgi:hypothetical protein
MLAFDSNSWVGASVFLFGILHEWVQGRNGEMLVVPLGIPDISVRMKVESGWGGHFKSAKHES